MSHEVCSIIININSFSYLQLDVIQLNKKYLLDINFSMFCKNKSNLALLSRHMISPVIVTVYNIREAKYYMESKGEFKDAVFKYSFEDNENNFI